MLNEKGISQAKDIRLYSSVHLTCINDKGKLLLIKKRVSQEPISFRKPNIPLRVTVAFHSQSNVDFMDTSPH